MATSGSSFTPSPVGHEDNLERLKPPLELYHSYLHAEDLLKAAFVPENQRYVFHCLYSKRGLLLLVHKIPDASVGHASTDCSLEPKCINCLQPHPSDSKLCPKWKIEKQIQEIKTTQNISYPEARKLIVPQLPQTYAQATKSSNLNNSTQTDENITKINCPPLKLFAPLSSKQRTNIPTVIATSSSAQT
ncbi:uncharacterized protein TNCV_3410471 [Trichonephila clavipes]|nr:uncharacterized protein TNCV_3410471 [Trichonephila clavipes]